MLGSVQSYPSRGLQAIRRGSGVRPTPTENGSYGAGRERRSLGSGPTITSRVASRSATVRVITPRVVTSGQSTGCGPPSGTRPSDGLKPGRPQAEAGIRIDPPPSEAVASGTMPEATATAAPPDEPPATRSTSYGLRVDPKTRLDVSAEVANSGALVLPTTTHPAARRRATSTESRVAGAASANSREPWVVR